MKTIHILAATVLVAFAFASCANEQSNTVDGGPKAVNVTSTIAGLGSRAVNASWTPGDQIGLYMVNQGTPLADANISQSVNNLPYANSAGTNIFTAVGTAAFFPSATQYVDFYAYYPYTTAITADYIYPVNVSSQVSQEAIDLLYSDNVKNLNDTATVVPLQFTHELSKLIFVIEPGDGITVAEIANLTITITGMDTTVDFSLVDGTFGTPGDPNDIDALMSLRGALGEAIVIPASVTGGTVEFALNNAEGEVFVWDIPDGTTYVSGSRYTYTVNMEREGVNITGSITDWNDVNGGNINPF